MSKMTLREFLAAVLPSKGPYITVTTGRNNQLNRHNHQDEIELVAAQLEAYALEFKPAYFAVGSFKDKKRTGKTALLKRALYCDIDCAGTSPQYDSKPEAMGAIKSFIKSAKMPPSLIVDSGNGYHLYWLLERDVAIDVWSTYAKALDAHFPLHGLKVDSKITVDTARVLRAPETVNFKDPQHPKRCEVIYRSGRIYQLAELNNLLPMTDPSSNGPVIQQTADLSAFSDDIDDLGGGLESKPKLAAEMVTRCPAFIDAVATGGEKHPGALWHKLVHTLAFCDDGEDYLHVISNQHPEYDPQETERRFAYALQQRSNESMGPTTCAKIGDVASSYCANCIYREQVKSPISLALKRTEITPDRAIQLPPGYFQNNDGIYRTPMDEDDATPMLVCPYRLHNVMVCNDLTGGLLVHFESEMSDIRRPVRVLVKHLVGDGGREVGAALSEGHMVLHQGQMREFKRLMVSWTQQMQRAKQVRRAAKTYGWVTDGTRSGFSAGPKVFWEDGSVETAVRTDVQLADQYEPRGDFAIWQRIANQVVTGGRVEPQIVVATAFAAPLLKFAGIPGAVMSFISTASGTGKTTALRTAQSVWGCPARGVNALNDTPLSVARKLGVLNNLPAYWDELRIREEVRHFIGMIFQVAQGKERSRLNADSTVKDMGTWNTLITVASNEALLDHVDAVIKGSNAGRARILEMTMPPFKTGAGLSAAMQQFRLLDENYGTAGEIYAKWLSLHAKEVKDGLTTIMNTLDKKMAFTGDERFWLASMSTIILGAKLAAKLGILQFDVPAIAQRLLDAVEAMREGDDDHLRAPVSDPEAPKQRLPQKTLTERVGELLEAYRAEGAQNAALVRGMAPAALHTTDPIVLLQAPMRAPLWYQLDPAYGMLRLNRVHFREWLYKRGEPVREILKHVRNLPGAQDVRGTVFASALEKQRMRVLDVDLRAAGWFDGHEDEKHENGDLA